MKPKVQGTMEARVTSLPKMRNVREPSTGNLVLHLAYVAEMQYKRKEPAEKLILCSMIDTVHLGESVDVEYHIGMRCYQHSATHFTSNKDNCTGDFFYTDGTKA